MRRKTKSSKTPICCRFAVQIQFTPTILDTRRGSCDTITPNITCQSHVTDSASCCSRDNEIQWQPRYCVSPNCGVITKISEESWQSRAHEPNFKVL